MKRAPKDKLFFFGTGASRDPGSESHLFGIADAAAELLVRLGLAGGRIAFRHSGGRQRDQLSGRRRKK
jgi:hypothetical protein